MSNLLYYLKTINMLFLALSTKIASFWKLSAFPSKIRLPLPLQKFISKPTTSAKSGRPSGVERTREWCFSTAHTHSHTEQQNICQCVAFLAVAAMRSLHQNASASGCLFALCSRFQLGIATAPSWTSSNSPDRGQKANCARS